MLSGISIICFAACYAIALALGSSSASRSRACLAPCCALADRHDRPVLSRTRCILANRIARAARFPLPRPPSGCNWPPGCWPSCIWPRCFTCRARRPAWCCCRSCSVSPSARTGPAPSLWRRSASFYVWAMFHGVVLLLGTVAVCVGFLAGLMYLVQSYALKHVRSPPTDLRLPASSGWNASTAARSGLRPC